MSDVNLKLSLGGVQQAKGEVDGLTGAMRAAALQARLIGDALIAGMKVAAGLVKDTFGAAVSAAREAQEANDNLKIALQAVGQGYDQNAKRIDAWATAMQRAFKVSDEDAKAALAQLIPVMGSVDGAMAHGALVADVAAKKQIGLAEAAKIVGLAAQGNLRGLRDMGIILESTGNKGKDAEAALAKLRQLTAGAATAQAARDPFALMKESLNEILEKLGKALLPTLALIGEKLSAFFTGLSESGQLVAIIDSLASGFSKITDFLISAAMHIEQFGKTILNFVSGLPGKIADAFMSGELATRIMDVVGSGFVMIAKASMAGLKFLGKSLWDMIVTGIPLAAVAFLKLIVDAIKGQLSKIPAGARLAKWLHLDEVSGMLGQATSGGVEVAKEKFQANVDMLKKDMVGVSDAGGAYLGSVKALYGDTLGFNAASEQAKASSGFVQKQIAAGKQLEGEALASLSSGGGASQGAAETPYDRIDAMYVAEMRRQNDPRVLADQRSEADRLLAKNKTTVQIIANQRMHGVMTT